MLFIARTNRNEYLFLRPGACLHCLVCSLLIPSAGVVADAPANQTLHAAPLSVAHLGQPRTRVAKQGRARLPSNVHPSPGHPVACSIIILQRHQSPTDTIYPRFRHRHYPPELDATKLLHLTPSVILRTPLHHPTAQLASEPVATPYTKRALEHLRQIFCTTRDFRRLPTTDRISTERSASVGIFSPQSRCHRTK